MFIVIDGPDGSGKSTIAKHLVQLLNMNAKHMVAHYTTDPTYSEIGEKIREILRTKNANEIPNLTNYFIEDRRNHVKSISDKSSKGIIVVCDRYYYSTVVYQHIQGESITRLIALNREFPQPDFAFIMKANHVDMLLSRIGSRSASSRPPDYFETRERLQMAIELYNDMPRHFPKDNLMFLNAGDAVDINIKLIVQVIKEQRQH